MTARVCSNWPPTPRSKRAQTRSGVVSTIVQGAIYTTLSAIPVFGSVLGNVVQTAMNAALGIGTISPDPFELAYSDLWGTLSSNFEALLAMTGQQEQAILSDWGN